ncbi:spore germination protein [Aquibacillus koreensis]|uniref:Spore germination protein n=1 Tax=Aquibacillus koreensis TaxID=279446 RepID=A0A9X3WJW3_9BACI|nr:spore germination protein [Aquibacillus koreensis]MCT2535783.1 spore germination protein [Aquibacillus koreensis]MDC3420238.1 spore germination protein [Aquibacillus koreensis]
MRKQPIRIKHGKNSDFPLSIEVLKQKVKEQLQNIPDILFQQYQIQEKDILIFYIDYQINKKQLDDSLLDTILNRDIQWSTDKILNEVPIGNGTKQTKIDKMVTELIAGAVGVYVVGEPDAITYNIAKQEKRNLQKAETESLVLGPQVSFTESLATNLNVIRWRLNTHDLVTEKFIIGERGQSEVRMVYLKTLANDTDVQTMRQRLQNLVVDELEDSSILSQYIEDNSTSIFPQFYLTELPDRLCYAIGKGRIGVLVDKSPTSIIAPSTFFSFFESTEDIYMRWNVGSFLRILRFVAMFISVVVTPTYVACVTFHYEVLPTPLLASLGQSRAQVPFPPIIEALLLELLIELLRESGARLPTKVGQTIGIVGGIVLGQAAVEAGLTSNVLIIVVASSALASFTAPSYIMGSAIRVIRFPLIIIAGLIGLIGVTLGICFFFIHLIRMTSLGRPYLLPAYPFNWKDMDNSFFRLPFTLSNTRSTSFQPKDMRRYPKQKAQTKKDIDE